MITREDQIEQSVTDYVKDGLTTAGYDPIVDVREAFPSVDERAGELVKTQVAIGFNFDDGGKNIELGSDLKMRVYTIEMWTFGTEQGVGRNVANVIRNIIEDAGVIPLKDIGQAGAPEIDSLILQDEQGVIVQRQIANNPRPWDRYVFTTTCKLEDTYYPALVN